MTKSRERAALLLLALMWLAGALVAAGCSTPPPPPEPRALAPAEPVAPVQMNSPPYVGAMQSPPISGMSFHMARLTVEIRDDFGVSGRFEGGYDERPFEVQLTGRVDRTNARVELAGEVATERLEFVGTLTATELTGTLTGEVSNEPVELPIYAAPIEAAAPAPESPEAPLLD